MADIFNRRLTNHKKCNMNGLDVDIYCCARFEEYEGKNYVFIYCDL